MRGRRGPPSSGSALRNPLLQVLLFAALLYFSFISGYSSGAHPNCDKLAGSSGGDGQLSGPQRRVPAPAAAFSGGAGAAAGGSAADATSLCRAVPISDDLRASQVVKLAAGRGCTPSWDDLPREPHTHNWGRPLMRAAGYFSKGRVGEDARTAPRSLPAFDRPVRGTKRRRCDEPQPQEPRKPLPTDSACTAVLSKLGLREVWVRMHYSRRLRMVGSHDYAYDHLYKRRGPLSPMLIGARLLRNLWSAEELRLRALPKTRLHSYGGRWGGARHTGSSIVRMTSKSGFAARAVRYSTSRGCPREEFTPETWDLDRDCEAFLSLTGEQLRRVSSLQWVMKPSVGHDGYGFSLHNYTFFQRKGCSRLQGVAQRYVSQPLLLHNRKFELRSYIFFASLDPLVVYYKHGYLRVSLKKYSPQSRRAAVHLVSTRVQRLTSDCAKLRHEQSPAQLSSFLQSLGAGPGVHALIKRRAMETALAAVRSVKSSFLDRYRRNRFFKLSIDMLFDRQLKPWVIELGHAPPADTNTAYRYVLMSEGAKEWIDIASETALRKAENLPLKDACSARTWELLLSEERGHSFSLVDDSVCVGSHWATRPSS
eukprot:PLAT9034.2.p1 GENE.PLAT9034.2~~PLAT9034.2.p1  ORF type:complete len:607 (+),score=262.98 PLAT9034.2:42-1823(+)